MPLSEDEQRILQQIEAQLYESDPALAREVASTTVYSHAFRNIKLAVAGFVAGCVMMVLLLPVSFFLAFGGFLVMLGSALFFERNARRLGRAGLEQMTHTVRGAGVRDYFGTTGQRMRERFRGEDE
ncbi:MAG: DUF3040 domain-containing protein [Acidimicrobiia bacterium]|nr:DUF3040 domain-containing protein [Acidimicrobiia bacterium]